MGDRDVAVKDLLRGAVDAREFSLFGEFVMLNTLDGAIRSSATPDSGGDARAEHACIVETGD
ncbi:MULTISPECIES: hypothetical protein [unclassified Burkholderia]|uniref:hypothetical protein n=1 Tax=unclassified Burkholderia TaxID=2613784 RepID=UPI001E48D15A|nr:MULTISPECIES: hypothetical protein [unclassified Burkholderia]UEP33090.1 hypothetical protein LMA01_32935 [Burkholderia sp. B21-007]UEP45847.1 hypothetical protein LMA02_33385 [Burkholderia sp. B21-005]